MDSWTPWILGKVLFMTPKRSSIDNCLPWKKENEEKMTLNTSQAEQAAANSIAYGQFLLILTLSCLDVSMELHLGIMNKIFPKICSVLESKRPMSKLSPFSSSKFLQQLCHTHVGSGVNGMRCYRPNKTQVCGDSPCQRTSGLVNIHCLSSAWR